MPKNMNKRCFLEKKFLFLKKIFVSLKKLSFEFLCSEVCQLMLILDLLGMYFDAAMVFFTISSLLFRMAMAMLWQGTPTKTLLGTSNYSGKYYIV